jgi:hypothetical protein
MNDPMQFQRPGPMPFRLLIDEAIRQARRHFRSLYLPVAVPVAVLATLVAVAQALWFPSMLSNPTNSLGMLPGFYLLIFIYAGIVAVAYAALQVGVIDALSGRPVDMKRAWSFAIQGRVLGTLFLWYAATVVSVLCCCLPVLYVGPLLSFVSPLMVDEGRFGTDALRRSAELANYDPGQGFFERPIWKVLLFLFIGVLISYLLGLLVALPFQIPMYIDVFRQAASGQDALPNMARWVWLQVPAQFLNALVTTAVYVYMAFGIALLFYDTRGRKEGVDLRSEIDDVFGGPPPELPLG